MKVKKRIYIFHDLVSQKKWFHDDRDSLLKYCNFNTYKDHVHPFKLRIGQSTKVIDNTNHLIDIFYQYERREI